MTWGIFRTNSVSEAYRKMKAEELKGKQHKLDVDKDGKIEGEDLAKLRSQKEEVEPVDEASNPHATNDRVYSTPTGTVHRAKPGAYGGYKKDKEEVKLKSPKALDKMDKTLTKDMDEAMQKSDVPAYLRKEKGEKPLTVADVKGPRKDSISSKEGLAKLRNEEFEMLDEEQLDELDSSTLKSYAKKANKQLKTLNKVVDGNSGKLPKPVNKAISQQQHKRDVGIERANSKISDKIMMRKEEVEQLDELSPGALKNYIKGAKDAVQNAKDERDSARSGGDGKGANDAYQLAKKRTAGIKTAKAKLNKEELDIFSETEIDTLINEVLKASDDAGKWISDFVKSDDPRFAGDSKEQRKKRALAAYYSAQKKESVDYDSFLEEAQSEIVKTRSKEIKHSNVKDKQDDQDVMEPNSEGEQDFLDKHTVIVTDDPGKEFKSGGERMAVSSKPKASGAGVYNGDSKLSSKDKASFKESASKDDDEEEYDDEDDSEKESKPTGKKSYFSFKEKNTCQKS